MSLVPTIHIAGDPIGDSVQFCSRCGIVLLDFEGVSFAVPEGQGPWSPSFWKPGAMVLRDGAMSCIVTVVEPGERECLPVRPSPPAIV